MKYLAGFMFGMAFPRLVLSVWGVIFFIGFLVLCDASCRKPGDCYWHMVDDQHSVCDSHPPSER